MTESSNPGNQPVDPLAAARSQMASARGETTTDAPAPASAGNTGASYALVVRELNLPALVQTRMIDSLTAPEQALARQIAAQMVFDDDTSVVTFGNDVTSEVAKFTAMIASQVNLEETDELGEMLLQVRRAADDLNVAGLKGKRESRARRWLAKILPFFRGLISEMEDFAARRKSAETALVQLEQKLQENRTDGFEQAAHWRTMKGINANLLGALQVRIAAAELKLQELEQEYHRRVAALQGSQDLRRYDEVAEFAMRVELFASTLQNLYKARVQTHQRGPKIKVGEQTANRLIQLVTDLIDHAMPNIRMEAAAYILGARGRRIHAHAAAVQELNERTMVQGAEQLRKLQQDSLLAQRRGIAGIESLRKANDKVLEMLDEGLNLIAENRKVRAEEQIAMQEMEEELRVASAQFVKALATRRSSIESSSGKPS